jgi:hypothetical protein
MKKKPKQQQHLDIDSEGRLRTKLYAKRDDYNFTIVIVKFEVVAFRSTKSDVVSSERCRCS